MQRFGLDWFAFVISFKGVFLEGLEVVFIVITFGLNAESIPLAAAGAAAACGIVLLAGALARRPRSRVPENTIKYAVGILLSTFGTFWVVEGLGYFAEGRASIEWPGGDWAIPVLLGVWMLVSQAAVLILRRARAARPLARRSTDALPQGVPAVLGRLHRRRGRRSPPGSFSCSSPARSSWLAR